jgi:hypothetical protein
VTWSATGGTVSTAGNYTAGSAPGEYRVIATGQGGTLADTAIVTIPAPPPPDLVAIEVSPPTATVASGQTQAFSTIGRLSDNSTTAVPVTWTATGGTVSGGGVYTAGNTPGSYLVIATEVGGAELADTAAVTVVASLVAIEVSPPSASVVAGATQQFSAVGRLSDNSTQAVTVTWTASAGSITNDGAYTAPGSAGGPHRVIATLADGGAFADTALVTVTAAGPTLVGVRITTDSVRVHARDNVTVTAVGRYSDNSEAPVPVTWSTTAPATAGAIDATGKFTATSAALGSYKIIAASGTLADTVPVVTFETSGATVAGPTFWLPVAPGGPTIGTAAIHLCTSNHFTDDPAGLGGTATVTATPDVGVTQPSVVYLTGAPTVYGDGSAEVSVVCQKVWEAPPGLVGTVNVTISVSSNRPGSGMAKIFTYSSDRVPPPDGRAAFTRQQDFTPGMTTATVSESYVVSASVGANIWFKSTNVP